MSARGEAAQRVRRTALRQELYDRVKASDLDLVDAVRMMRKVAGKSQAEYARLVGISPRVLIDFERRVGNPTLETLRKMLEPFGLELTVRRRGGEAAASSRGATTTTRPMRGMPASVLPALRSRLAAILARPDVEHVRLSIGPKPARGRVGRSGIDQTMLLYGAASAANALETERRLFDSFVSTGKLTRDSSPEAPPTTSATRAYVYLSIVWQQVGHEGGAR